MNAATETPSGRPRSLAYLGLMLAAAIVLWAAAAATPDDPYQRYKASASTDYIKAGWIYERLHFDPTPIDIAFLGSSRSMQGIDGAKIEDLLGAGGRPDLHVANLALPALGRDVDYLIARQLLEAKRPKLLVVEVDYIEFHEPNPSFLLLADMKDVAQAPLLINENLASDLFQIPARNLRLLWEATLHGPQRFAPQLYAGPHWDDVYITTGHDGVRSPPRLSFLERDDFEARARGFVDGMTGKARQYDSWAWVELRYTETYLKRLLDMSRDAGVKIVFLYMSPNGAPPQPFNESLLRRYGDIWPMPEDIRQDYSLWFNPTHLNFNGAERLSAALAQRLLAEAAAAPRDGGAAAR
jgi:hypothetical protein